MQYLKRHVFKVWHDIENTATLTITAVPTVMDFHFYQRISIASYASAGIARAEMSVCLSVTLRYCIKTKTASVMVLSPSESPNILVSGNMWIITKIERGHPE